MARANISAKPKYWCKHCKTFVRDTKLEKQNHEATPKHQGNLQRFLRDLHRGNERVKQDAQRAKDEVARLNGITAGSIAGGTAPPGRMSAVAAASNSKKAGPADRKRQLQQLADMGIAVPEETRREMAMAGDWRTLSVTPVYNKIENPIKEEEDGNDKSSALAVGVRKRKHEGDEEKQEAGATVVQKGWGSTTRSWNIDNDGDLDALLETTQIVNHKPNNSSEAPAAVDLAIREPLDEPPSHHDDSISEARIKREPPEDASISAIGDAKPPFLPETAMNIEDAGESGVIFKKRKSKSSRQR